MTPRRVGRHLSGGPEPGDAGARERKDALREAWSRWPAGVAVAALRADGRVHAVTVSALIPVSFEPPLALVSFGPNAAPAPFLEEGRELVLSVLAADQRGIAARYADSFPVGPSPFPESGPPAVRDALAVFRCSVEEVLPRGDHRLAVCRVEETALGRDAPALVYRRRDYAAVD